MVMDTIVTVVRGTLQKKRWFFQREAWCKSASMEIRSGSEVVLEGLLPGRRLSWESPRWQVFKAEGFYKTNSNPLGRFYLQNWSNCFVIHTV